MSVLLYRTKSLRTVLTNVCVGKAMELTQSGNIWGDETVGSTASEAPPWWECEQALRQPTQYILNMLQSNPKLSCTLLAGRAA